MNPLKELSISDLKALKDECQVWKRFWTTDHPLRIPYENVYYKAEIELRARIQSIYKNLEK